MSKMILGIIATVAVIVYSSVFTVDQREKAILFSLGEIKDDNLKPGLHFKIPLINNVIKFDSRILTLDSQPERFLTSEKKNVSVSFYVKWRIADVGQYYRSTRGNERTAQSRLAQIIKDGLRNEFAVRTIQGAVSGERLEIMRSIMDNSKITASDLGIEVVDVRISRIDLPDEVSGSVYERMRAERARIAKELRAQGQEAAEKLRANADKQRSVLLAEAYREAQQLRGEGDGKAAEIYAQAYQKNAEFYNFYRSLEAYRKSFQDKSDILVMEPNTEFFQYFNTPKAAR